MLEINILYLISYYISYPPMSNHGGIYHPHPSQGFTPLLFANIFSICGSFCYVFHTCTKVNTLYKKKHYINSAIKYEKTYLI